MSRAKLKLWSRLIAISTLAAALLITETVIAPSSAVAQSCRFDDSGSLCLCGRPGAWRISDRRRCSRRIIEPRVEPRLSAAERRRQRQERREIREIQTVLNSIDCDAGSPDGVAGRRTRSAVRCYQEAIGATPTGHLTERQRDELLDAFVYLPSPRSEMRERLGARFALREEDPFEDDDGVENDANRDDDLALRDGETSSDADSQEASPAASFGMTPEQLLSLCRDGLSQPLARSPAEVLFENACRRQAEISGDFDLSDAFGRRLRPSEALAGDDEAADPDVENEIAENQRGEDAPSRDDDGAAPLAVEPDEIASATGQTDSPPDLSALTDLRRSGTPGSDALDEEDAPRLSGAPPAPSQARAATLVEMGENIAVAQYALRKSGYDLGETTGEFDDATLQALDVFHVDYRRAFGGDPEPNADAALRATIDEINELTVNCILKESQRSGIPDAASISEARDFCWRFGQARDSYQQNYLSNAIVRSYAEGMRGCGYPSAPSDDEIKTMLIDAFRNERAVRYDGDFQNFILNLALFPLREPDNPRTNNRLLSCDDISDFVEAPGNSEADKENLVGETVARAFEVKNIMGL